MNIDGVRDFKTWRQHARDLLRQQVHPTTINWAGDQQTQLAFAEPIQIQESTSAYPPTKTQVPANFLKLARAAACYRDDDRWALLYSLLWRLTHDEPHLLHLITDPEVRRLRHMAQAVRRDAHKMHAFVRFKKQQIDGQDWYVAWFEPNHLIVPDTADFFIRRFNTMNWSILTPDACAHWDQQQLKLTEGCEKPTDIDCTGDDMDDYWRQYYRHIFNPARLKTRAMQSEMPKKYWHNLPEAELINELTQGSGQLTEQMLRNATRHPDHLRQKSKRLREQQDRIRAKNEILNHPITE
ncbi:TIGR03915 family putative DNA repair protein [Marinicella sediminis]|uniref:TIGR03915 family putative DNA repair protein n=1 Tax=Marinicella sediminis TaxID=1792834 RepID=A0ABV7J3E7_9GAMM|nr:TIGR03915 family putative DNA repair protein [Marinicella sediminis]